MSLVIKIAIAVGVAILILGAACVIIAALFPPKEYKGNSELSILS